MKKILFIDNIQNIRIDYFRYSTGLLTLSTILREKGHDVEILNFDYLFIKGILPYSADPIINFEYLIQYIIDKKPHIVGFTTMCNSFHNSLIISKTLKQISEDIKIIFGGPHASILSEKIMKECDWIDLICMGEGENTIEMIAEWHDLSSIPGIVYRRGDEIIKNQSADFIDLNELPELNYDLIPYFPDCDHILMEVGRGCPYNCIYCSTSRYWRHKFRIKSQEKIIKEILNIKKIFSDKNVNFAFIHDNFTTDRNITMELCEKLRELHIAWGCSARLDRIDEELLSRMALAGCREIHIGVETASPGMQKYIRKNLPIDKLYDIIHIMGKYNIKPIVSFMYGFPEETEEDLKLTLNTIISLRRKSVQFQFHALCILAGTELYEKHNEKLVLKDYYSDISQSVNIDLCRPFIKKNKELFSHFYILEDSLVDRYPLLDKFTCYIFGILYEYFPRTLDLIIKIMDNDFMAFYGDFWINSYEGFVEYFKKGKHAKDFIKDNDIISDMYDFFCDYLEKKSKNPDFNIILNTFGLENLKFVMAYSPTSVFKKKR